MKTCKIHLILIVVCANFFSSKEGLGQQGRYDGVTTLAKLACIPDSLKTPEQVELVLKLRRVYHTNIKFRGDSIAFLMDKDAFLSEGLSEEAYWEFMYVLRKKNELILETEPKERQILLSTQATDHAVYLKFLGYEYLEDIPLIEFSRISFSGLGGSPLIVNPKGIDILVVFPVGYFDGLKDVDTKVVPK